MLKLFPELSAKVLPAISRIRRRRRIWAAGTAVAALLVVGIALLVRRDPLFPGSQWSWRDPAEAGFDGDHLRVLSDRLGGTGCIAQNGRMIHAWGKYTSRGDIASAMKPVIAHFTLKAVEEGLISSLDVPVSDWVPELGDLNPDLDFKDRAITFRHLLQQISGYALREPPGEAFAYNDLQTGLLLWVLIERVYGCGYHGINQKLIEGRLGHWLQFEDSPTMLHERSWPGRLRISARDLARFGHLYLREGLWGRRAALPPELAREALTSPLSPHFPRTAGEEAEYLTEMPSLGGGTDMAGHGGWLSFFWWVNRETPEGGYLFPDAPAGTFAAVGHGGRSALIVIPEYDLVAVWMDAFRGKRSTPFSEVGRWRVNEALDELLQARLPRG